MFRLHLTAWKNGVKSLYYLKSTSPLKKKDAEAQTNSIVIVTKEECIYCDKLKNQLKLDGKTYQQLTVEEASSKGYWKPEYRTTPQLWENGTRLGGYTEYMQEYHKSKAQDFGECIACEG